MVRTGDDLSLMYRTLSPKHRKLGHAVKGSYRVSEQDQHSVFIQYKKLAESITDGSAPLAPRRADVPLTSPKSALAMHIQNKNLEEKPWVFHEILDHFLKYDGLFEFLLNLGPYYEATWEPC